MKSNRIKSEFRVRQHDYPIINQKHDNNAAGIKMIQMKMTDNVVYCQYVCIKETCRQIMENKFIYITQQMGISMACSTFLNFA